MGCGLSKAHSNPEVLVSHGNARTLFHGRLLIVAASSGRLAPGPHRHGDGDLAQVCEDLARPVSPLKARPVCVTGPRVHTRCSDADQRRGRVPESSSCAGVSAVARTGSAPSSGVASHGPSHGSWRRHQMPPLATLDPITGEVIRASKATAVRYERARPGELVHMDVKKLGRIPDGGGWKAHGRGAGPIRDRAIKDRATTTCTRWSTTTPGWPTPRSCPTKRAPPARRSCDRALDYFAAPRHRPSRGG